MLLLASLFWLAGSSAAALETHRERCTPKDLRPGLPPVHKQGDIGWCYAYTTADLLSLKAGRAVSPIDVALAYNARWDNVDSHDSESIAQARNAAKPLAKREGGSTAIALKEATEQGVCWEEESPSPEFTSRLQAAAAFLGEVKKLIGKASKPGPIVWGDVRRDSADASQDTGEPCREGYRPLGPASGAARRRAASEVCRAAYESAVKLFPNATRRQFFNALAYRSLSDVIPALASNGCRRRRLASATTTQYVSRGPAGGDATVTSAIAEQLDRDNAVAVIYDGAVIRKGAGSWEKARHSSSVVGRRWDEATGTCQVLVRDSHGSECDYAFPCEKGHVWVPIDVLAPAVRSVSFIP